MPSHYTHTLFAEDAFRYAFGTEPSSGDTRWLILGAKGPDPFYTGLQRRPSGVEWGAAIHTEGFGRLLRRMTEYAADSRQRHFVLGYATHAVLDRVTHPLINYFSGWKGRQPADTEKKDYRHPYLERLIDVLMVRRLRDRTLADFDYTNRLPGMSEIKDVVISLLASSIRRAYPSAAGDDSLEKKIVNAYLDDDEFLSIINPGNPDRMTVALRLETDGRLPKGTLALQFPDEVPEGDFLNLAGAVWRDPRLGGMERHDSIPGLYEQALEKTVKPLRTAAAVFRGEADAGVLEELLGNSDLSDESPARGDVPPKYCDALPLADHIEALYRH